MGWSPEFTFHLLFIGVPVKYRVYQQNPIQTTYSFCHELANCWQQSENPEQQSILAHRE